MLHEIRTREETCMQHSRSGVQPPYGWDSLWRCFSCPEDTTVGCSTASFLPGVVEGL